MDYELCWILEVNTSGMLVHLGGQGVEQTIRVSCFHHFRAGIDVGRFAFLSTRLRLEGGKRQRK